MVNGRGASIAVNWAEEELGQGLGKMEEGLEKVLARRIDAGCSDEGDRWEEGRNELCSAPFEQRMNKEMRERVRTGWVKGECSA